MRTRTIRGLIWAALALVGVSGLSAADAQARPRPKYRKAQPVQARVWMAEPAYTVGRQVAFTVTVDRPAFVAVFRVDAAGRRFRLTCDPGGVWVTPHQPLRAPGPEVYPLFAGDPCGSERIVVVTSQRAFRSASDYFVFAHATDGAHGSCGVSSCGYDVVRRPVRHRAALHLEFCLGGLDFEVGPRARVYADGLFIGIGPSALACVAPGRHRLTVVDPSGHKYARRVEVPDRRPARAEYRHAGRDGGDDRYDYRERR